MSKNRKCEYTYCIAAAINNKRAYHIRAIVFLVGLGAIVKNAELFNFTSIALLLVPALTDNYYEIIKAFNITKLLWIDRTVKFVNCAIIIMCILGEIGFIADSDGSFEIVSTALILSGFCIKKEVIATILLLDFMENLIMGIFIPKKFDAEVINSAKKMKGMI